MQSVGVYALIPYIEFRLRVLVTFSLHFGWRRSRVRAMRTRIQLVSRRYGPRTSVACDCELLLVDSFFFLFVSDSNLAANVFNSIFFFLLHTQTHKHIHSHTHASSHWMAERACVRRDERVSVFVMRTVELFDFSCKFVVAVARKWRWQIYTTSHMVTRINI